MKKQFCPMELVSRVHTQPELKFTPSLIEQQVKAQLTLNNISTQCRNRGPIGRIEFDIGNLFSGCPSRRSSLVMSHVV